MSDRVTHLSESALLPALLLSAVCSLLLSPALTDSPLHAQSVKQPARRGTPAQIQVARAAFSEGIDNISRNPSAFFQALQPGTGCAVTVVSTRPEKSDSLRESHTFDAGHGATKSRMAILPSGGVIQLTYATAGDASLVVRERRAITGGTVAAPVVERVAEFAVLAAETSRQSDVTSFLKGWSDLVHLCGGLVEP